MRKPILHVSVAALVTVLVAAGCTPKPKAATTDIPPNQQVGAPVAAGSLADARSADVTGSVLTTDTSAPSGAAPLIRQMSDTGRKLVTAVRTKARSALHLPATIPVGYPAGSAGSFVPVRLLEATSAPGVEAGKTLGQALGIATALGDAIEVPVRNTQSSASETADGGTHSGSMEFGRSADGTVVVGMGLSQSASSEHASASVKVKVRVEGVMCPDANGLVDLKFSVEHGGNLSVGSNSFAGSTQIDGKVSALVGDDAHVMQLELTADSHTVRPTAGGGEAGLDLSFSISRSGSLTGNAIGMQNSNKITGHSGDITNDLATSIGNEAMNEAWQIAANLMAIREALWLDGACVEVLADAPANVEPGATTKIAVKVRSKTDHSSLEVPVDTALSGGASVDPTRLDKAPGTVTHTAVNERGKTAKLTLTSTSRRGVGKKTLTIRTMGGYDASGQTDQEHFSGTVCDPSRPFTLTGSGGANVTLSFTPTSATGGTMSYTGRVNNAPLALHGKGTYQITETDNGGTLTFTETGSVQSAGTKTNTTVLTLTPSQSCTN